MALYYDLVDDLPSNDPYLVSIQPPEEYIIGHIPGSQNMAPGCLLDPAVIVSLPHDHPLVIVSRDGEEASAVAAMLRLNGVDSVFLVFGMDAWHYPAPATNPAPNPCVDPRARMNDYPIFT